MPTMPTAGLELFYVLHYNLFLFKVLFNALLNAYYAGFIPCLFAQVLVMEH